MSRTAALHLAEDASSRRRALRAAFTGLLGLVVVAGLVAHVPGARATMQGPDLPPASPITSGPGQEWASAISGDWLVYQAEVSGGIETRYLNLSTQASGVIPQPGPGVVDFLGDIDGTNVVFQRYFSAGGLTTSAIYHFDITAGGPPTELAPVTSAAREMPAIGGNTVAWIDWGTYPVPGGIEPSLALHDRATGQTALLPLGQHAVRWPSVSPDGQFVAWQQCDAAFIVNCDIYQAVRVNGAWQVGPLAASPAEETDVRVGESRVVYSVSYRDDESLTALAWQPLGGGTESRLTLSGRVGHPDTSGRLIVFSHKAYPWNPDESDSIWVYDVATDTLRRASDGVDQDLYPNVSVSTNGTAHVAWSRMLPTGLWESDVYGVTFQLAPVDADPGLDDLIELVEDLGLHHGLTNSLLAKLNAAAAALEGGDTATACTRLMDFSNEVSAQSGKKISTAQAAELLGAAADIRAAVGCGG